MCWNIYKGSKCVCGVMDEGQTLRWAHEAQPPVPALPSGTTYSGQPTFIYLTICAGGA